MNELDRWTNAAIEALGLDAGHAENALVLDVARDVAHGVLRPAAPVAAYLFGVAVGRGADPAGAAATLTALAERWAGAAGESGRGDPAGDPPPVRE
ncbi:MAG TPA: DUF6457 domain-containing protein [Micromonosporaceae bacterium]|nr:DUF6457 domain-containing protein [Micromonosporaceae bacterium]